MLKKIFLFFIALTIIAVSIAGGALYYAIVLEPGEEIKLDNIHKILGKESHVFYNDGKSKLGVFFDKAHRQYVTYNEIPHVFVNALVASEDDRFFSHFGFDVIGITRAMIKNIEAGRVVQGGSTLTQQTAKNLFKRSERSFEAKLKELLFALRLEYHYSKEQIFEFYANQFYVSGNAHGIGVAARYYFDKKTSELNLAESAFIAGSVKRPNYYNPFIKKSKETADLARSRAATRLKYVLGKMRSLGMIDNYTYNSAISSQLEFKQGKVGFSLDYAMEMVKDAVSSTEVLDALAVHGFSNVATSGVRVITTVDKMLQEKTLAILRRELSRLDVRMRGYNREEVQAELNELNYKGDQRLRPNAFLFGTIEKIEGKEKETRIWVNFGRKIGAGIIENKGLSRLVTARAKWLRNRWSETEKGDIDNLVEQLQPGDKVWTSVLLLTGDKNALLELQKYPKIQGGALVLKDGEIKGMAGGTENRFYNRAIYAKRTMGSAFKPYVFTAAQQLGWNSADLLKNNRDLFVYHGQPYFPRPDHKSPFKWVSMSWAGVHSENVASVWLLSRLCDRLNPSQFRETADFLGLAPRVVGGEEETYRSYRGRIRDKYGLVVDRAVLHATAFRQAVINVETDFIFDDMVDEYEIIKEIHYGLRFEAFNNTIDLELINGENSLREYEKKELKLRKKILGNHFQLLASLRDDLTKYMLNFEDFQGYEDFGSFVLPVSGLFIDDATGLFSFQRIEGVDGRLKMVNRGQLANYLSGLDSSEKIAFWMNIQLNAILTIDAFDKLSEQVDTEYAKLKEGLPYSFETLSKVKDFRIMVGLHYLVKMAKELGIKSTLDPVLSFPLGSNVVTLLETTRMYEALITGKVTTYGGIEGGENNDSLAIIDRIESADGDILYQPKSNTRVLVDEETSLSIGHILENIVKFGTGRMADKKVRLPAGAIENRDTVGALDLKIPLLGKTGTANNYTNASFFGYLPGLADSGESMIIDGGYAVGVYVGYDDNKAMRKKSSRISGSAGALPAWNDIVNVLLREDGYAKKLDPVDLSFYGLILKRNDIGQLNVSVEPKQGGKVNNPLEIVSELSRYQPTIMTFGQKDDTGSLTLSRHYRPFWQVSSGIQ